MSTTKIKPATPEVSRACDAIDTAIGQFLAARREIRGYEKYESTVESQNLFNLCIRHVEGVITAAREDLVLLPAAHACARAALETAAKGAWIVDHDDPFVREARWLAHLQEEERVYERSAKRYAEMGHNAATFMERCASIRQFREGVAGKMPSHVELMKHNPSVDDMLEQLDGKILYPLYIYLSQFVHGGHLATSIYRSGLGTFKQPGEYIEPSQWFVPLRISWLSLSQLGALALWRLGRRSSKLSSPQAAEQLARTIQRVSDGGASDA
jgi:hypothetical protein